MRWRARPSTARAPCALTSRSPFSACSPSPRAAAATRGRRHHESRADRPLDERPPRPPALEALLPNEIDGVRLTKASATGANVFGGDAFSRAMTTFLTGAGKRPSDLTFANARDASGALEVELGVFRVPGVGAGELRRAIVDSSRPGAPGSTTSRATIAGKPVTLFRYATGSTLYLYEQGDRVFYVGTLRPALAAKALAALP